METQKESEDLNFKSMSNDMLEKFENQEVLKLVKGLMRKANFKDFIESINNGHLADLEAQMKIFKLNGKEISSMSYLNQCITTFFHDLDKLYISLNIYKEMQSIEEL